MAETIFPTIADVGGGINVNEANFAAKMMAGFYRRNFVITGMKSPTNVLLAVTVPAGEAWIGGYHYKSTTSQVVNVNANETNAHWFLQLTFTASKVTGTQWVRVLDPSPNGNNDPADSVNVFATTTNGTTVTSFLDTIRAEKKDAYVGQYTGDGIAGTTQDIDIGFRPALVIINGDNGTRAQIWSCSTPVRDTPRMGLYVDGSPASGASDLNYRVADLLQNGFRVLHHVTNNNLNENTRVYNFIAWPR